MTKASIWTAAALAFLGFASGAARANLNDCQDLYVGRVWLERGYLLRAVVLLNNRTDNGGSYWIYFDYWSADEKKAALATLTAAKMAGQRVHVLTDDVSGCGITAGGTYAKQLFLANTQ